MQQPCYTNKRGARVELRITNHAKIRFRQRWKRVFPAQPLPRESDAALAEWFAKANRIQPQSRKYRKRLRRHGKDTLYFRASPFVFVVQAACILTVELGTTDTRHLNRCPPTWLRGATLPVSNDGQCSTLLPRFKLTAASLNENNEIRHVTLGSYDASGFHGRVELLRKDSSFFHEVLHRFKEKRPQWRIRAVFASLGKNGQLETVWDENMAAA